jgi:hypothetical protein
VRWYIDIEEYHRMTRISHRELFLTAKEDMLATAIRRAVGESGEIFARGKARGRGQPETMKSPPPPPWCSRLLRKTEG